MIAKNKQAVVDLLMFISMLYCAWLFQWSADELVWSLWVSSLTIGYLTLILGPVITGGFRLPGQLKKNSLSLRGIFQEIRSDKSDIKGPEPKELAILILAGGGILLFIVAFFTVHFGMFHFIHGVFLESFFPLETLKYPKTPFALPSFAVALAMIHWPFVFATAISQFYRMKTQALDENYKMGLMAGPYKSVIRMHLLIFVFAFLKAFHANHFLFYAVVLFAYFFPWNVFIFSKVKTNRTTIA